MNFCTLIFPLSVILLAAACKGTDAGSAFVQENEFALSPPLVRTGEALFQDSVRVEMQLDMPGVRITYTLDGTSPGASGIPYEGPFYVKESATVQAVAQAAGWLPSEPSAVTLRKRGMQLAEAFLKGEPSPAYPAEGATSLIDGKKGSANFRDGRWLGFEGEDLEAILDLGADASPGIVWVSCMEDPGSWILYPSRISVEGSRDGVAYEELVQQSYEEVKEGQPGSQRFFELPLPEAKGLLRFLRVRVESRGSLPEWHPGAAEQGKPWLFVDEIGVE